ncbi:MAG: saccharopine dehydrogenase NADP-binding domain-containing protein [Cyclobacteriaceae bacterium]|nr:saccharopine dehydrogenase NADP-binding domain-containing protein [Cyclobacteriaceae bacterium]
MKQKSILVLGAGRSSTSLIHYLVAQASIHSWIVTVGDISLAAAQARIEPSPHVKAIEFNILNEQASHQAIAQNDVVISLMPANLHPLVAKICLLYRKHLLTASYVSDEMKSFNEEAKSQNLLFLNECGLDPGIDHMSAMQIIDKIKSDGGELNSFESFTGGLIAPETDPLNPWRYKFTWNPRNVVMAGQGTARFLQDGHYKFIPYQQLFNRITPVVVPGFGEYEGYANRDSLKYLETYGLHNIKTMLRGTLRNKGYCSAWNVLVQLGCCDDSYAMEGVEQMTHIEFINSFLVSSNTQHTVDAICKLFSLAKDGQEITRLKWSGLFSDERVGLTSGTPAQILEHILNKKWKLAPGDKDFIVMWHRFLFSHRGQQKEIQSYLTVTGDNEIQTAMAKTVGLPLGIAARLLLQNKITSRGVVIPVMKEIYEPVLHELSTLGITMTEREIH